jgi:UDP-2,3-diacylglucosamine pyrophosphatase LpxH
MYSLLPKNIALKIAKKISHERKDSHYLDQEKINRIHDELDSFAQQKIDGGFKYVIMGHYHHLYQKELNNGELILLGECNEENYNYAMFDGDKLEIKNF